MQNAAFALSNLARGENGSRKQLLSAGIMTELVRLLDGDFPEAVISEVSWVLSYLSSWSVSITTKCLSCQELICHRPGLFSHRDIILDIG